MSLLCQIGMTLPRIFREVPGVTVRLMSDGELARLEVLRDLDQRGLTPAAAGRLLGLERRQVFRLLRAYRAEGPAGLISKRRGGPGNRRKPPSFGLRRWRSFASVIGISARPWQPRSWARSTGSFSAARRYASG
jgi:hypothetical protein